MKTWNFGIIGAGVIADFHARAINDIPNANLVGFCDSGSGRAKKLADKFSVKAFTDYKQMATSDDIDVLSITTPSGFHLEPAVAAAQAGKHVICEKPLEVTLERIDTMIEAHKKAGTQLGGIFQSRFNDCVIPLRKAIDKGRFGTITYAAIYVPWWRSNEYYQDSWHGTWKLDGGGSLMNQSIHMVDLLCHLMPPIESLQAFSSTLGHPQIETEDTTVATLRFTTGALGVMYSTTASFPGRLRSLEITGTKGTAVLTEDSFTVWQFAEENDQDQQIREKFGQTHSQGAAADPAAMSHQGHTKNIKAFIEALDKGQEFCLGGTEARKAVEVILAIYKSAKDQTIVKLI